MQVPEPILLVLEGRLTKADSAQAALRFVSGAHAKTVEGGWERWLGLLGVLGV